MTSSPSNTCRCRVVSRPHNSAEVNVSTVNVSDNTTSTKVCLNVYAVPGPNVLPQNAKKHCTYRPFYLQYSPYAAMPKGVNLYFTNSERKPYWFVTTIRASVKSGKLDVVCWKGHGKKPPTTTTITTTTPKTTTTTTTATTTTPTTTTIAPKTTTIPITSTTPTATTTTPTTTTTTTTTTTSTTTTTTPKTTTTTPTTTTKTPKTITTTPTATTITQTTTTTTPMTTSTTTATIMPTTTTPISNTVTISPEMRPITKPTTTKLITTTYQAEQITTSIKTDWKRTTTGFTIYASTYTRHTDTFENYTASLESSTVDNPGAEWETNIKLPETTSRHALTTHVNVFETSKGFNNYMSGAMTGLGAILFVLSIISVVTIVIVR
ncbi:hypothetical protein LSAT2_021296 [Lamellibrachia satsuma]|nr:hypothetical protein LSAT2_021296 [Lamellibrachia satsuma]